LARGFTLKGQNTEPITWTYDLETNEQLMLAQPAFLPSWLP
jgi:hypothetical protein